MISSGAVQNLFNICSAFEYYCQAGPQNLGRVECNWFFSNMNVTLGVKYECYSWWNFSTMPFNSINALADSFYALAIHNFFWPSFCGPAVTSLPFLFQQQPLSPTCCLLFDTLFFLLPDCCVHCILSCLFCEFLTLCNIMLDCATCGSCSSEDSCICCCCCGSGECADCDLPCDMDCGIIDACCESADCLEICMECCGLCFSS